MKLSNVVGAVKEAVKPVLSLTEGIRLPRSISKPKPMEFPAGEGIFSQPPFKNPIASAIGKAEEEAAAMDVRPVTQKLQSFPEAYAAGQLTKTALFKQGLAQQVDKGIEQHPEAQVALEENITAMGMGTVGELRPVAQGATTLLKKAAKEAPVFEGFKDLSLKTLEKLKGRSTVDKQFIQDLTNQADLKQPEREVLREVLDTVKGKTVKVKEFAERVKTELLPLKRQIGTSGAETVRYEQINLPDEMRGAVQDYHEVIYESPIKNTAGDTHFSSGGESMSDSYFGHVRTEDLPDQAFYDRMTKKMGVSPLTPSVKNESVRRVIEVQSDLYQKGTLQKMAPDKIGAKVDWEGQTYSWNGTRDGNAYLYPPREAITGEERAREFFPQGKPIVVPIEDLKSSGAFSKREGELAKLGQYNDPTAHFRMIREEVKRAAQDGKKKLQFPTGETAMKVEGLGMTGSWHLADTSPGRGRPQMAGRELEVSDIKNGTEVRGPDGEHWVIIEDSQAATGQFEAVPVRWFNRRDAIDNNLDDYAETFDISGSIDKNNPIYKFYEKDVAKYLKNKYGAKLITDPQGVTWMEVDIKPEHGTSPVEAFSFIPLLGGSYLQKMIEDGKEEPKPVLPRRIKGEPVLR